MPRIEAQRRGRLGRERRARRAASIDAEQRRVLAASAFSLPTRIGQPEGKTSPEELLAAAHGGCLTMSLAGELIGAEHAARTARRRRARIVMDEVEGQGHQIVALARRGRRRGRTDSTTTALQAAVAKADEGCPFSQLLRRAGANRHVVRATRVSLDRARCGAADAQGVRPGAGATRDAARAARRSRASRRTTT